MSFDVKAFVADHLKRRYHRPCITVMDGCCRICLRGTPSGYDLKKKTIRDLMDEGKIDPYQIANAFHVGSTYYQPYFKEIVVNMKSDAAPCQYPGNCNLKCVLCFSLIMNSDDVELDIWPGFKVHKSCTSPCLFPCCPKRLPTLPAYLSLQRSTLMCELHQDSSAFNRLSVSTATAIQERKEALNSIQKQPPCPMKHPELDNVDIPSEPAVKTPSQLKTTHSFKKPAAKAKADKFDERGKSKSIFHFFQTPKAAEAKAKKKVQEEAIKASKLDDAPRRFIKNRETGEIFGYWKGNDAYHIETNELLFTRDTPMNCGPTKFDFSPPVRLAEFAAETSVSLNKEEENEGGTSP